MSCVLLVNITRQLLQKIIKSCSLQEPSRSSFSLHYCSRLCLVVCLTVEFFFFSFYLLFFFFGLKISINRIISFMYGITKYAYI